MWVPWEPRAPRFSLQGKETEAVTRVLGPGFQPRTFL